MKDLTENLLEFSVRDGVPVVRITDAGRAFLEDKEAGRIVVDPFDAALESCIRKGLMRRVTMTDGNEGIEITELGRQVADAAIEGCDENEDG